MAAGGAVWSVDERSATDMPLPPGASGAAALAVSPGGGFVAAFCGDGRLRVFASGARPLGAGKRALACGGWDTPSSDTEFPHPQPCLCLWRQYTTQLCPIRDPHLCPAPSPADFSRVISELDTSSAVPPLDLAWCGGDAVALRWEGLLLLAGPYGDW